MKKRLACWFRASLWTLAVLATLAVRTIAEGVRRTFRGPKS